MQKQNTSTRKSNNQTVPRNEKIIMEGIGPGTLQQPWARHIIYDIRIYIRLMQSWQMCVIYACAVQHIIESPRISTHHL